MTIRELAQRSSDFVANIDTIIASIVDFNEDLEDLNRKQLRGSKLADGSVISRSYSIRYAWYKQKYFPSSYADGKVNLLLTGDLYKSLELRASGREYSIMTDRPYAAGLYDKYGNFLGIAPENQPEAQRITGEKLAEKYKQMVLK